MRLHLQNLTSRLFDRAGATSKRDRSDSPPCAIEPATILPHTAVPDGLAAIAGRLRIRPFQADDGYGFDLIRTDCEPTDVVAVVYDSADRGVGEAMQYARLLALSPVMQALLAEALGAWSEQFDGPEDHDLSISGADLVEWFAEWRLRVRDQLSAEPAT
jgi:hypothetical protein